MKKFEDLSKAEREKVSVYLQYISFLNISAVISFAFGLTFFLAGYTLVFVFTIPAIMLVGIMFIASGMFLVFATLAGMIVDKKYLFLIFGYKNLYSDIFGVKKNDLKKVKIIREVKWIKE